MGPKTFARFLQCVFSVVCAVYGFGAPHTQRIIKFSMSCCDGDPYLPIFAYAKSILVSNTIAFANVCI